MDDLQNALENFDKDYTSFNEEIKREMAELKATLVLSISLSIGIIAYLIGNQ